MSNEYILTTIMMKVIRHKAQKTWAGEGKDNIL